MGDVLAPMRLSFSFTNGCGLGTASCNLRIYRGVFLVIQSNLLFLNVRFEFAVPVAVDERCSGVEHGLSAIDFPMHAGKGHSVSH